jgi:chemotaxis protein methyltransferase CheR
MHWRLGNVLSGSQDGPWDIILWRNMAIYFKLKPARQVWEDLIKELRPGGLLVAGKVERPPASSGLRCISRCVYQYRSREGKEALGC